MLRKSGLERPQQEMPPYADASRANKALGGRVNPPTISDGTDARVF